MHAGGENGFSQAIELASDTLSNVKFVQEKRLISKFFDEISQDTGKYGFGVHDTLQLMEMGAVETLIVWENLEHDRCTLKNTSTGEEVIKFLSKEQQKKTESFKCVLLRKASCHATSQICLWSQGYLCCAGALHGLLCIVTCAQLAQHALRSHTWQHHTRTSSGFAGTRTAMTLRWRTACRCSSGSQRTTRNSAASWSL